MAGRGISDIHRWTPKGEGSLVVVRLDYGYLAPWVEPEESCSPFLFGKDSRQQRAYALAMPQNGIENSWCAKAVALLLSRAVFARVVLRSDTELAIVAL